MDNIDDTVVTSVLTDALNRYMKYLEVEQELHERSQPHQGKDAQTDTDLARIEYFHARTLAVDSCLQVVDRIAENVKRWVRGEDDVQDVERGKHKENGGAEGLRLEALEENLISFDGQDFPSTDEYPKPLWQEDEPFINPLTGQWVTVVNSNSAGPSNTPVYDAFSRNLGSDWPLKVRPSLICPESATPVYDEFSRNSGSDWPLKADKLPIQQAVVVRKATIPNTSVDLHGMIPLENISYNPQRNDVPKLLELDDYDPYAYETQSTGPLLPPSDPYSDPSPGSQSSTNTSGSNTPSTSHENTGPEPEDIFFDAVDQGQKSTSLQSEWAAVNEHVPNTQQFTFFAAAPNQLYLDHQAALKLQTQFDNEILNFPDEDVYARQQRRDSDFSADLEAAKRLAREWEEQDGMHEQTLQNLREDWTQEDKRLEEQAALAAAMRRYEEESDEEIRRGRAAALAAQNQWEQEALEAEDSTKRLREQMEREEEEEIERMRAALEQATRLAEELERQEEEERQRLAAEAAEAERRERQADCVVCMDPEDKADMYLLDCEHYYCEDCIVAAFNTALTSRAPFRCCGRNPIPASLAADVLPAQIATQYDLMILELTTPNPRYCSARNCRLFIPPNSIHGPIAVCPSCHTRTCSLCNNAEHGGVCAEDREGAAVVAMAQGMGWKACPRCNAIVDKNGGCLHMTCKISSCGAQWCWECLRDWAVCNSTCNRR